MERADTGSEEYSTIQNLRECKLESSDGVLVL
jgi:hypothetical protein